MASSSAQAKSLPHLLSLLPKNGQSTLVRPASWPPTSYYQVTRSKLKFRAPPGPSSSTSSSSSASSTAGTAGEIEGQGSLKAFGKAWGMLYRNGKYQKPASPLSNPDSEIRQGLKKRWVQVDPSALPSEAQTELARAAELLKIGRQQRLEMLNERRAEKRSRRRKSAIQGTE